MSTQNDIPPGKLIAASSSSGAPLRRSVFDDDEFDKLNVAAGKMHVGRRETDFASTGPDKASILAALATFDSDDDERDDTYDIEDVGGTIDHIMLGSDEVDTNLRGKKEEVLYSTWRNSPHLFKRDAETRRGEDRALLKSETGLSDEAIEGWAVMLLKEPALLRQLEIRYPAFTGEQKHLASTSWRAGYDNELEEGQSVKHGEGQGHRGSRGRRGHHYGGQSRGGHVAGPVDGNSTRIARQRKDANKSSRANHNRRDQRARKMSRAGFPG